MFCFDPGETCGVAILRVPEHTPVKIIRAFEIPGTAADIREAFLNWHHKGNGVVICEDWDRNDARVDPRATCQTTGMLMMLADEVGVPLIFQRPVFRTSTPDSIEGTPPELWLPNIGGHDHRRQAFRHGLAHLMFTRYHLPTLELLQPR